MGIWCWFGIGIGVEWWFGGRWLSTAISQPFMEGSMVTRERQWAVQRVKRWYLVVF